MTPPELPADAGTTAPADAPVQPTELPSTEPAVEEEVASAVEVPAAEVIETAPTASIRRSNRGQGRAQVTNQLKNNSREWSTTSRQKDHSATNSETLSSKVATTSSTNQSISTSNTQKQPSEKTDSKHTETTSQKTNLGLAIIIKLLLVFFGLN